MNLLSKKLLMAVCGLLCIIVLISTYAYGAKDENQERVARGRYLVKSIGCADCHTPWMMGPNGPEQDWSKDLSGHPQELIMPPAPAAAGPWVGSYSGTFTAWAGPWGVSFSANITPDKETGIGDWTEENFVQTIRTGRHMGKGRMVLPPMPVPAYSNMTDDDLKAIYAYLMTVPAISNKVPEPVDPPAPPSEKK